MPKRFRLTRRFPVSMTEDGYRRLRRFATEAGLDEGEALLVPVRELRQRDRQRELRTPAATLQFGPGGSQEMNRPTRRDRPATRAQAGAKQAGPGLHLGRGLALQLSARSLDRGSGLTRGYPNTGAGFILANKLIDRCRHRAPGAAMRTGRDLAPPGGKAHVTLAREITGCLKEDP
jgi:hypothetical protein